MTSDNPAIPRLAIVTAFAQSLDLLEYWFDLISNSTSEVSEVSEVSERAKEKDDCRGRTTPAETLSRVRIDTDWEKARFGVAETVREKKHPQ